MRTKPLGYDSETAVGTTGEAFALPITTAVKQVKVFVSELAYVGFGASGTPTAIASDSPVAFQEANTEVVYTLDGISALDGSNVWVYAVTGAIANVRVSFLG